MLCIPGEMRDQMEFANSTLVLVLGTIIRTYAAVGLPVCTYCVKCELPQLLMRGKL